MYYCIDCKYKYTRFDESPCKECRRLDHFEKGNAEVQLLEYVKGKMVQNMNIINSEFGHSITKEQKDYNNGLRKGIELIDEVISELKGEINNE